MNIPHCPSCGTKRDASFIERDGQCVAIHCIACENADSCCPECGTSKISRAKSQLELRCSICEDSTFPDLKIRIPKRKLTPDEVQFLLDVGDGLSLHFKKLRSFDEYEEETGNKISEREYIDRELRLFIVIKRVLEWRSKVSTVSAQEQARLLSVDYFANEILTDNTYTDRHRGIRHPTYRTRIKRAHGAKKIFMEEVGLSRKSGRSVAQRMRQEIIIKCYKRFKGKVKRGDLHRLIAKELDKHPEIYNHDEVLTINYGQFSYEGALEDPHDGPRVKALFSNTWNRYKKGDIETSVI